MIALQAARGLPAVPATTLAVLACAGVVWAYVRSPAVRFFGLLLSGATIFVPTILVVDGDVRRVVDNSRQPVAVDGAGARAPIVLVVFDEWSVISILDSEGRIDREPLFQPGPVRRPRHLVPERNRRLEHDDTRGAGDADRLDARAGAATDRGRSPGQPVHPARREP